MNLKINIISYLKRKKKNRNSQSKDIAVVMFNYFKSNQKKKYLELIISINQNKYIKFLEEEKETQIQTKTQKLQ